MDSSLCGRMRAAGHTKSLPYPHRTRKSFRREKSKKKFLLTRAAFLKANFLSILVTPFISKQTQHAKQVLGPLFKDRGATRSEVRDHALPETGWGDNVRYRMIDVSLRIEKPQGMKQIPSRIVQVVFADYSSRRNIAVLVDDKGKVFTMKCFV